MEGLDGVERGGVLEDESRGPRCRKGECTASAHLPVQRSFPIFLGIFEERKLVHGGGSLEMLDIYRNVSVKDGGG